MGEIGERNQMKRLTIKNWYYSNISIENNSKTKKQKTIIKQKNYCVDVFARILNKLLKSPKNNDDMHMHNSSWCAFPLGEMSFTWRKFNFFRHSIHIDPRSKKEIGFPPPIATRFLLNELSWYELFTSTHSFSPIKLVFHFFPAPFPYPKLLMSWGFWRKGRRKKIRKWYVYLIQSFDNMNILSCYYPLQTKW